MRMLRDVFYINSIQNENEIVYYGMQFNEFMKYTPVALNQLLLIKAEYFGDDFSDKTGFEVVEKDDVNRLLKRDIYNFGDFCWVDFDKRENVETLEPAEIAQLLYLGHMFKPVNSPFFDKIQNRYAYLAHDDGWFCRLYCRCFSDFREIIANKVVDAVSTNKRRKIYPFSEDLKDKMMSLAEDGLLIDFSKTFRGSSTIEIPIHCIGKILNMDQMYNGLERHIYNARYSARLVHKNKKWMIDWVVEQ